VARFQYEHARRRSLRALLAPLNRSVRFQRAVAFSLAGAVLVAGVLNLVGVFDL
jgi:hypothetical protein